MIKKISVLMFALLIIALFNSTNSNAQPTKTKYDVYPVFSIAPVGGIQFPIGGLNDIYNASFNAGIDLALKVNKETSFYLNAAYYDMPRKSEIAAGPNASYIVISAGPRYIFATPKLKAKFFLEAGAGVYILNTKEYTLAGPPSVIIASESATALGVNGGAGVIIPLGESMDLLMKEKLHYTFEKGGDRVFISTMIGLDFKL